MENSSIAAPTVVPERYNYDFFNVSPLCNETRGRRGLVWKDNYGDPVDASALQDGSAIWLALSLLIVAGNMAVIQWRCLSKKEQRNSIPSILVINLAFADFFLGIQLCVYVLMSGKFLCSAWVSPNDIPLMMSLCVICAFLETTCICASAMLGATIAFYYAAVVFGRFFCIRPFSRRCLTAFLSAEWIIAVIVATCNVILTSNHFGLAYTVKTQEIKDANNVTNRLIPDNSTFALISPMDCLPLLSYSFLFSKIGSSGMDVHLLPIPIVFAIMCVLVLITGGTYIAIVIKLLRLRASNAIPNLSTSVGGLGFRLVAIALITLLGWITAAALFFTFSLRFGLTLPCAFVALSNPLTFTLTSKPFLKAVTKFKQMACYKIGRTIPIEDVINDSESLISTKALPSDTN